ncbi:MAG: UvrD-helicase domain-containing protein [Planctomycetes bacterium]|nr:UvrD-helicase domain-containing protein [Planctomycetota bacterium]
MTDREPEVVTAGAGTGKTYDIVERVVRAITQDGVAIQRIAAITFTNRAADELAGRLTRRLKQAGRDEDAREVDTAYLSTIHAFCLRLLTEHPVESGIPPETRSIDEEEASPLLRRAISDAMSARPAIAEEVRFVTQECLAYDPQAGSSEDQLREKVLRLIDKARGVAKSAADLRRLAEPNDQDLVSRLPPALTPAQVRKLLAPALRPYEEWWAELGGGAKLPADLVANHEQVAPLLAGGDVALACIWTFHCKTSKSKKWQSYNVLIERLQAAIEDALPRHADWQSWYRRYARALFAIAAAALERYEELKVALGLLDYADMQVAALRLLRATAGGRPFADTLRARFGLLVVDEFQDTSPLQYRIAEELRGGRLAGRYVGDLKQAIYGWRDADARLFESVLARVRKPETLRDNYRSRKTLVDFVNALFRPLFAGVKVDYEDMRAKSAYVEKKIAAFGPELALLDGDTSKPKTAERIARWLAGLLGDRSQRVYDRELECERTLRPGDVAVLARTNREVSEVSAALAGVGLRSSQAVAGLGDAPEVGVFRALVAAFSSPENRLSLAAALVSEVYGLSFAGLYALGRAGLLRSPRRFHADPELRAALSRELSPADLEAVVRFYADLDDLHVRFRREPLVEVVDRLFERTRLRDRFAGKADGPQRLANLERCREEARAFASLSPDSLTHRGLSGRDVEAFLAWFDQGAGSAEEPLAQTRPVDEEAVQVMTIHKAKGLEFPIVVVYALQSRTAPVLDRLELVRSADADGPAALEEAGLRLFPGAAKAVPKKPFLEDAAEGALADAVRNLYVAMTRARERLVLVWPVKDAKPGEERCLELLTGGGVVVREDEHARLVVGGKAFAAEAVAPSEPAAAEGGGEGTRADLGGAGVSTPVATPADARDAALCAPDATAFEFGETPDRERGGVPRLSPSSLIRWFDCPLVVHLEERCHVEHRGIAVNPATLQVSVRPLDGVVGLPPAVKRPAPGASGNSEGERARLGTLMHRAVAAMHLPASEVLARMEALAGPSGRAYAARVLEPIRRHLARHAATGEWLIEHPFLFEVKGTVVSAVLDLAIPTADGLWIYDLKTNDITAADVPRYSEYYAPQLWTYALAAERALHVRIAWLALLFATPGLVATLPPRPAGFAADVAAAARRIAAGPPFEKRAERVCETCPWKEACPVGSGRGWR